MPAPTSATTLQRPDLGVLAYEYLMAGADRGFIGLELMPIMPVPLQAADYPVIPLEALLKDPDSLERAPRSGYARTDYEFKTLTYSCKDRGIEEPLDDVERKLYSRFFDAEEVAVKRATDIMLRAHEKRVAAAAFNATNISLTSAVTTEWSTAATCTPQADVKAARETMRMTLGFGPNVLVMAESVFQNVSICKDLTDKLQYTAPLSMMPRQAKLAAMAMYFEVERILVGNAMKDTAKRGIASSLAEIWDDEYVGLYRVSSTADMRDPSLGRTFMWTEDSPNSLITETYRQEEIRCDIYRVRNNLGEALTFSRGDTPAGAGYLLSNITA